MKNVKLILVTIPLCIVLAAQYFFMLICIVYSKIFQNRTKTGWRAHIEQNDDWINGLAEDIRNLNFYWVAITHCPVCSFASMYRATCLWKKEL